MAENQKQETETIAEILERLSRRVASIIPVGTRGTIASEIFAEVMNGVAYGLSGNSTTPVDGPGYPEIQFIDGSRAMIQNGHIRVLR